jgi:Rod binding domain-containing protein
MTDPIIKQPLEVPPLDVKHRLDQMQRALSATPQESEAPTGSELEKACREMESIFLNFLLKEMRNTISKSGFISGGTAENIYTGMLDAELSKVISERGGMGLSKILYDQLVKGLEKEPHQGD